MLKNWIISLFILVAPSVYASSQLELVDNLSRITEASKASKKIVIVLVTQPECGYCEYVKSVHIEPMLRKGTLANIAVVRELGLAEISITDFSGKSVSPGKFARRYDAEFAPSLLFLSAKGEQLHEPIIGVGSRDYYGYYLDKAIENSVKLLNESD
ncbi:MAG: thioredoxin-related protein [Polaribacter sp.]|jgi:thioredoxin-related protein